MYLNGSSLTCQKVLTEIRRLFECEWVSLLYPSGYLYFCGVRIEVTVSLYHQNSLVSTAWSRMVVKILLIMMREHYVEFIANPDRLLKIFFWLCIHWDHRLRKCCDFQYIHVLYIKSRKHHFLHVQADALHVTFKCYTPINTNWYDKTCQEEEEDCDKVLLYGGGLGGMWEECVDVLKWQWEIMKGSS